MAKKSLKIVSYTLLGLIVLILLLAGLTQTQFFRDRVRSYALSTLDSVFDAHVYLGSISGNLITGFSVDSISVTVDSTSFMHAARLSIGYNLFELPGKIAYIQELILVRPEVNLVCDRSGVWNFQNMLRHAPTDTSHRPFDWTIVLNRLVIRDGRFTLVDSSALSDSVHAHRDPYYVEYHEFSLRRVDLVLSGAMRKNERDLHLASLSFLSDSPGIELRHAGGEVRVSRDEALVKDFTLETARSRLAFDADLKNVDLFSGVSLPRLKACPVRVSLHAPALDLNELKRFIPDIAFLNDSIAVDLAADGEFGNLGIRRLDLRKGRTQLTLSGTVLNLHTPEKLSLAVKSTGTRIYSPDVLALLPAFDLPDLKALGVATLNMDFTGTPTDFRTKILLGTDAGQINVDGALNIGGPRTMKYRGTFAGRNVNLARILDNDDLTSSLNCSGNIEGEGVSIHGLSGTIAVDVDSSEFRGQRIDKARLVGSGDEDRLHGTLAVAMGRMRSEITAELDEQNTASPTFDVDARFSSLNLEDLFHKGSLNSDLTMTVRAQGTGLTLDDMNGDLSIEFAPSRFGEYQLTAGTMDVLLDQRDRHHKQLKLESNIADVSLTGAFDTRYLQQLLVFEVHNIRAVLHERFASYDTTGSLRMTAKDRDAFKQRLAHRAEPLDVDVVLRLKDLEPISIVTGNRTFNGTGVLKGTLKGSYENLSVNGTLTLDDFFYGNADAGVLIEDLVATMELNNVKPVNALKDLDAQVVVDAGKLHINRNEFDSVKTKMAYERENGAYYLEATYNNVTRLSLQGSAGVSKDRVLFHLDDLEMSYKDFAWKADTGAVVEVNDTGVHLSNLSMRRDSQAVTVEGTLGGERAINASIKAQRINLNSTHYLFSEEELGPEEEAFNGVVDAIVTAQGTLDHPRYTAFITAENVSYRLVPFGKIRGEFTYVDQLLSSHVEVDDEHAGAPNVPELSMDGTLPLNLALSPGTGPVSPDAAMDLHIVSDGIQMGILDPLVPTFNDLNGILRCNLRLTGSPKSPVYEGSIGIDSCSFLFLPNNISYSFQGTFQPASDRIKVLDAVVRSDPSDELLGREGKMHLTGDFSLRDFVPTNFNLSASGDLLIVKETTRKSELSVYGNLFVEIGPEGLHFTGTLEHSKLQGDLIVRNSSLIFPPTQVTVKEESPLSINLKQVDDTTSVSEAPRTATTRYFGSEKEEKTPAESEHRPTKSFLDGVAYDLNITAEGGDTEFRMIFNPATNEELVAYITGKFSVTEDGTRWVGDLDIAKAYYNFFKRFDAEGKIVYTGDFQNPELDITGQYQGTRMVQDSTLGERKEKVIVSVKITGTRYEPKLDISMTIDGVDYNSYSRGPKSYDVRSDAVQFVAYGSFPLTASEKENIPSSISSSVGISLLSGATSLFTNELSDFLQRETGFIKSVEFQYGSQGSIGERAEISLSGVAAGGTWKIGNSLANSIDKTNVSLLYSVGDVFKTPSLRNFMVEYERRPEESTVGELNSGRPVNSARFFYRISF